MAAAIGFTLGLSIMQLMPVPSAAAPLITSINAEGWSGEYRVPGNLPAMTTNGESEMTALAQSVAVSRPGFDGTGAAVTYVESRLLAKRKRKLYPDCTLPTVQTVAFDDYVYATDSVAGVVNNSTEVSPKPVAAWVMPSRLLVGNSVHWEIIAFHRDFQSNRQVACVRVRANNGTTQTAWQTVAVTVISTTVEDANPIEVYQGDLDVTALATGAFWLEAEVCPWIGDTSSITRTEDVQFSAGYTARKFGRRYFHKDTARAAAYPQAWVDPAGNDSTGVWSTSAATAAATPFLTLSGAHAAIMHATRGVPATGGVATGCRIRINGTVNFGTVAQVSNPQGGAGVVVERAPAITRASAVLTMENSHRPNMTCSIAGLETAMLFTDLTLKRTSASTNIRGEAATFLWWSLLNVTLIDASGTFGSPYSSSHGSFYGVQFDATTTNFAWLTEQTNEVRLMRGITADMNSTAPIQWVTIGCKLSRVQNPNMKTPADGCIVYSNKFLAHSNVGAAIGVSSPTPGENITGVVVLQNLIESIGTGTNPAVRFSADGASGAIVHGVFGFNTGTGYGGNGRWNIYYDESQTPDLTNRRNHRLIRFVGNIVLQANTKGDWFVGSNGNGSPQPAEAPNRIGQLAFVHGVGCEGNWQQFAQADGGVGTGGTMSQLFAGPRSHYSSSLTVRLDPKWVNYQGAVSPSVAGAGGGDYHLTPDSPARGLVSRRGLKFDLGGAARPTSGYDACGAYA